PLCREFEAPRRLESARMLTDRRAPTPRVRSRRFVAGCRAQQLVKVHDSRLAAPGPRTVMVGPRGQAALHGHADGLVLALDEVAEAPVGGQRSFAHGRS